MEDDELSQLHKTQKGPNEQHSMDSEPTSQSSFLDPSQLMSSISSQLSSPFESPKHEQTLG